MRKRLLCPFRLLYSSSRFTVCSNNMAKKTAIVLLAPGAEEMEFVISADVLRRCGVEVTVAGVNGKDQVKCSRDIIIVPDLSLGEASAKGPYDVVILPGGLGGSKILAESSDVGKLLKEQESSDRMIAAICAAPTALKAHKIGLGKSLTSYPSVKDELKTDYKYCEENVVVDGKLVTSRGPGTAFDFALAIAAILVGKEIADKFAAAMLYK